MNKDDILREAINLSGYYKIGDDVPVCLDDTIDISFDEQVSIVLARELKKFRPDLFKEKNKDVVYIICNGDSYQLPSIDLTDLLQTQKPFSDAKILTYSLSEKKILKCIYKGDGTKWVLCK